MVCTKTLAVPGTFGYFQDPRAGLAQLDRALASGAKGQRFESSSPRHPPCVDETASFLEVQDRRRFEQGLRGSRPRRGKSLRPTREDSILETGC